MPLSKGTQAEGTNRADNGEQKAQNQGFMWVLRKSGLVAKMRETGGQLELVVKLGETWADKGGHGEKGQQTQGFMWVLRMSGLAVKMGETWADKGQNGGQEVEIP